MAAPKGVRSDSKSIELQVVILSDPAHLAPLPQRPAGVYLIRQSVAAPQGRLRPTVGDLLLVLALALDLTHLDLSLP